MIVKKRRNAPAKQRVAAYCRVSTLMDVQDTSYETQREAYLALIQSTPEYQLVDIYGDHGKSGKYMKSRPELQRLLKDCEDGKVDLILTKSISRFARNMKECVATVRHLQELGVAIYFEKEGINSTDTRCELLLSILASIAQEESNSIGQNAKWTRDKYAKAGRPMVLRPYGFKKKGTEWVIEESQAKRVRLAFDMADRLCTYTEIRTALAELEASEGCKKRWGQNELNRLFKTVAYKGDYLTNTTIPSPTASHGRVRNRGEHEQYYLEYHHTPIVPRAQFDRVQTYMAEHLLFTQMKLSKAAFDEKIAAIRAAHPDEDTDAAIAANAAAVNAAAVNATSGKET